MKKLLKVSALAGVALVTAQNMTAEELAAQQAAIQAQAAACAPCGQCFVGSLACLEPDNCNGMMLRTPVAPPKLVLHASTVLPFTE
eukprot:gene529-544_t